jgi:hypothetical protein
MSMLTAKFPDSKKSDGWEENKRYSEALNIETIADH